MNQIGLRLTSASARAPAISSATRFKSRWGTRRLHQQQALPYPAEQGLGNFLPPEALKVQLEYQDGLLKRLNEQVVGTTESGASIAQTVINLAGKQDQILAFNYASLALNNSFFLSNLKPPSDTHPNYEHEINDELHTVIRNAHGDIQQLRSAFSAAALGTFINGWVWFVADQSANTGIITTYGAGTLLVRSRANMQRHPNVPQSDLYDVPPSFYSPSSSHGSPSRSPFAQSLPPGTSPSSPLSGISGDSSLTTPKGTQARYMSDHVAIQQTATGIHSNVTTPTTPKMSKTGNMLLAGEILHPLFCVPVYEHAWMSAGYGVWGKEQWLKEFWSVLNWGRVDAAYREILRAALEKHPKKFI